MLSLRKKVLIALILTLLSVITFSIYKHGQELKSISNKQTEEEKLLFYAAKSHINKLLSSLLYTFEREKVQLIDKHKLALEYLKTNPIDKNLDKLQKILNKDKQSIIYDIYIINPNYKIINSTLKSDIGFDLSFAKDTFLKHKKENIIGVSGPIYEDITKQFFSYTDSFMTGKYKGHLLQVSYRYNNQKPIIEQFNSFLLEHKNIKSINAYMSYADHIIFDFPLLSFREYKPSANEYKDINDKANKLLTNNNNNTYKVQPIKINDITYRQLSIIDILKGHIEDGTVILNILLDNSKYDNIMYDSEVFILGFLIFGILLLLIVYIFFEYSILVPIDIITNSIKYQTSIKNQKLIEKNDEIGLFVSNYNKMYHKLQEDIDLKSTLIKKQDIFVKNAIHEINTPLNIMLLNNELRERKYGTDIFSKYITSAITTIENTFQDLSYMMNTSHKNKIIEINLIDLLKDRIDYFTSITNADNKQIILNADIDVKIIAYLIDISRLIDNNISNAIKYSEPNTTITINLYNKNDNTILSFHNMGIVIKDTKAIFNRYFREDNVQGGYGIGLHIVNTICKKYNYKINVESNSKDGTIFAYTLKK